MSRLIGELVTSRPLNIVMEQKSVEENVGAHLLQTFDDESGEEEE
jgi:hypothetical protein